MVQEPGNIIVLNKSYMVQEPENIPVLQTSYGSGTRKHTSFKQILWFRNPENIIVLNKSYGSRTQET